jgi:hypothetical protein
MVGNRTILALSMLAAVGCGSSGGSTAAGGSGGSAQGGTAGQGGAGGSANSGAPSGGASSGGASGGSAGSGGGAGSGGSGGLGGGGHGGTGGGGAAGNASGGASGFGGLPACVGDDDASAPFVDFVRTADPAPAAMGGQITSGTYFLTALTYHGGTQVISDCALSQTHEVLRVTVNTGVYGSMLSTQRSHFADGTGQLGNAQAFAYQAQGTSLLIDYTCWEPDEYSQPYTATSNQILFIRGPFDTACDKGVTLVFTYDKQP